MIVVINSRLVWSVTSQSGNSLLMCEKLFPLQSTGEPFLQPYIFWEYDVEGKK